MLKSICKYILSIALVFIVFSSQAQEEAVRDSVDRTKLIELRVLEKTYSEMLSDETLKGEKKRMLRLNLRRIKEQIETEEERIAELEQALKLKRKQEERIIIKSEKKLNRPKRKAERKARRTARVEGRRAKRRGPPEIETYRSNGKKYNITGISIGPEVGQYAFEHLDPNMLLGVYYEAAAQVQINNKFFLNADYGYAERSRNLGFGSFYDSQGSYLRFGIDYNIVNKSTDIDAIFVGLRYATSTFDHEVVYNGRPDYYYTSRPELRSEDGLNAQWFELVGGFKARLFWQLYFGITARMQFITSFPEASFTAVSIPGHGFDDPNNGSKFNVGYYLTYRFPLWK